MNKFKSKKVIAVSGTPGVGKTSFSKLLAKKINGRCIDLSRLASREKLLIGMDLERKTKIVDMKKLNSKLKEILKESARNLILNGHYSPSVLPSKLIDLVIILRLSPLKLKERLKTRGYPKKKIYENICAEALDVCTYEAIESCGVDKVCELDTTNKSLEDLVKEALSIIEGKNKPRVGTVNWLKLLEDEGKIDEILNDKRFL
ncbi:MAG: adenylate kinase family protein [Candidatus Bathyarchaeia archaeon]